MLNFLLAPILVVSVLWPHCQALESIGPIRTDLLLTDPHTDLQDEQEKAIGVAKQEWEALAKLVLPGMTTDTMMQVLPPRRPRPTDDKLVAPIVTLWNGQSFHMRYALDDDFWVDAIGTSSKHSALVLSARPRISPRRGVELP